MKWRRPHLEIPVACTRTRAALITAHFRPVSLVMMLKHDLNGGHLKSSFFRNVSFDLMGGSWVDDWIETSCSRKSSTSNIMAINNSTTSKIFIIWATVVTEMFNSTTQDPSALTSLLDSSSQRPITAATTIETSSNFSTSINKLITFSIVLFSIFSLSVISSTVIA